MFHHYNVHTNQLFQYVLIFQLHRLEVKYLEGNFFVVKIIADMKILYEDFIKTLNSLQVVYSRGAPRHTNVPPPRLIRKTLN